MKRTRYSANGVGSLAFGGLMFALGGIAAILLKVPLRSETSTPEYIGLPAMTVAYSPDHTVGFGAFFLLLSLVLFLLAYRVWKTPD